MNIKEFWESDEHLAIHCDTLKKAKRLLRIFILQGHKWARGIPYTQSGWSFEKQDTCYDNRGAFGNIHEYKVFKIKVIEFNDLDEFKPYEIKGNESRPTMLTSRAWKTYNLIKSNSIQGKWTTKKEIVANDKFDNLLNPLGYIMNDRQHDVCAGVWEDIDNINSCPEIDKIIVSNGTAFKLAENYEEAYKYIESFKNKAINSLIRYSNLKRKVKANGQGKLLSNRLDPIDEESQARDYVETYLKGED